MDTLVLFIALYAAAAAVPLIVLWLGFRFVRAHERVVELQERIARGIEAIAARDVTAGGPPAPGRQW